MSSRGLVSVLVLALAHGGCAFTWEARETATSRSGDSPVRFAGAALPGRATLDADGVLRFALDASALCQQDRLTIKRRVTVKHHGFSTAGKVEVGAGLAVGVGGIAGAALSDEPAAFGGVAAAGLVTAGILLLVRYAAPNAPKTTADTGDWPVVDRTDTVPCSAEVAAEYATLDLVTPWGAMFPAPVGADGVAGFAVEWLDAPRARETLATPWQIRSATGALTTTFTPTSADVEQVLALTDGARDREVTGATPALLQIDAFQVDGAAMTIGGTGLLSVTLTNTGASTAVGVTARTRSTLAALDGVTFAFGKIQPGRSATQTVTVKVPAKTTDDQVLVRLVVSAGDLAPVEGNLAIPLSRTICPAEGLSREAYDQKRDRLKAARDAGAITAAEFDQYDAELLSCLK